MNQNKIIVLANDLEWSSEESLIECYWKFNLKTSKSMIKKIQDLTQIQLVELLLLVLSRIN